jgi:formate dehydrogenase iron-sulfur subunit
VRRAADGSEKETGMKLSRRALLRLGLAASSAAATTALAAQESPAPKERPSASPDYVGVLVDTTLCIGCRKCEEACNRRNHLPRTAESFSDRDVLRTFRRPTDTAFTVVNQFPGSPSPDQATLPQTYSKVQCMHCLYPSCVSACIVGALTKSADGAVVYNPTICIGCRYCQVACPFQIPAYEFSEPLTPRVRKCEFCADQARGTGANPACAASCPTEALVFGRRADLVAMAKDRLKRRPDRYLNHLYGETEVGGTSWLYLTGRPVEEIGLLSLPDTPPPQRTEAIQHGIFKYGLLPVGFYGLLAGIMWYNHRKHAEEEANAEREDNAPSAPKPGGGVP